MCTYIIYWLTLGAEWWYGKIFNGGWNKQSIYFILLHFCSKNKKKKPKLCVSLCAVVYNKETLSTSHKHKTSISIKRYNRRDECILLVLLLGMYIIRYSIFGNQLHSIRITNIVRSSMLYVRNWYKSDEGVKMQYYMYT